MRVILSVQSWVCYGHVGNAAALFPLNRLGAEVLAINTVQFSNHTGYGDWTGEVFSGAQIAALVDGVAARGALARCEAVLSGYLGDAAIGEAVLDAVGRVRTLRPNALYCCDPVLGDEGRGLYVRPGLPEFFRERCVPEADILTPNHFELAWLAGRPVTNWAEARHAVEMLRTKMRPGAAVLVTSLRTAETPDDAVDVMAADGTGAWLLRTPKLDISVNGAGDVIAALFLFHRMRAGTKAALEWAASSVFDVLAATAAAGSREILSVAAQEAFVQPNLILARAMP